MSGPTSPPAQRLTWRSKILMPGLAGASLALAAKHDAFCPAVLVACCFFYLGAVLRMESFIKFGDPRLMRGGKRRD